MGEIIPLSSQMEPGRVVSEELTSYPRIVTSSFPAPISQICWDFLEIECSTQFLLLILRSDIWKVMFIFV